MFGSFYRCFVGKKRSKNLKIQKTNKPKKVFSIYLQICILRPLKKNKKVIILWD